jgi:lipoprotein-anchoring transpeptidase ErfK/SrfK
VRRGVVLLALGAAAAFAAPGQSAPGRASCAGAVDLGSRAFAYIAYVRRPAAAYREPGRRPFARFDRVNVNGYPTLFLVRSVKYDRSCHAAWYRVQLPLRPNGVTGYVPAGSVDLQRVATRIVVDLSARSMSFMRRGRVRWTARVGIGASYSPTPTGSFYVNQRLVPKDPTGPWGPSALGISAFSPVYKTWTQGGPIAIHGTNDPGTIGRAASHGCIRIRNALMRKLFAETPAGTPVLIRA